MFWYSPGLQFPLQNPSIYLFSDITEFPIVIDTGASFSIAPTATDFTQEIVASSCTFLNQISGKTDVLGKGPVKWDIEPTATIRLFSPQAYYILGNNAKA